ncbi:MAG TPA: hypothetical protein VIK00_00275 [Candidatus Limnocylindrales bacterium]
MDMIQTVIAVGAVVVTALLWATAIALRRVDLSITLRGLRNGLLVALALFALTFVLEALLFNVTSGLIVGLVVGAGYFWIGSTLIPVGLVFKSKPAWTTLGAWAAVPVIVVSIGFGYTEYRSANDQPQSTTANGTIALSLNGLGQYPVTANGVATCSTSSAGDMALFGGTAGNAAVMSQDGRVVQLQFSIAASGANPSLSLTVGSQTANAAPQTMRLDPGSSPTGGHATLAGIDPLGTNGQPDPSQVWSGDFSWSCGR